VTAARRNRKWWQCAAIALAAMTVLGCSAARDHATTIDGGTMRINVPGADPEVDPALGPNNVASAQIQYAICAKLLNLPDRNAPGGSPLIPEIAAAAPTVSPDGRTYTFTIRRNYRFSNGARVTPEDVRASMNRVFVLDQALTDDYYSDVRGAEAVTHGQATGARGLVVHGRQFVIRLNRPDATLPAKLADSSACVLPRSTPVDAAGVDRPVTAGPYFVARRIPDRQIVLKRNLYYRGPRPHHITRFVFAADVDPQQSLRQVEAGKTDMAPVDVKQGFDAVRAVRYRRLYGINRGRFRVDPDYVVAFLPLNTSRGAFKSLAVRRAVNYALDRRAMIRAVAGPLWGTPADQILPTGVPGHRRVGAYPLGRPDFRRANAILRRAHKRCGDVSVYETTGPDGLRTAQVVRYDLRKIHCRVQIVKGGAATHPLGDRNSPYDTATAWYYGPDYLDPYGVIDVLLDGRKIRAGLDWALFDQARVNRLMDRANRLRSQARIRAYARLDALITKRYAPWAVYANQNQLTLLSSRVRGYVFKYSVGGPDLAAMWLKR